jgi:hypothetical protein
MGKRGQTAKASERAALARQQMREREERMKQTQEHYAKFGDRVVQLIHQTIRQEGDLRRLVHRVTGRVVTDVERQHEVLLDFLHRHGEAVFLREARPPSTRHTPVGADRGPRQLIDLPTGSETLTPPPTTPSPKAPPPSGKRKMIRLPSGEMIEDRRSGKERRTGKDRRNAVDLVYRNKRYGKDRRSGKDRRRPQS